MKLIFLVLGNLFFIGMLQGQICEKINKMEVLLGVDKMTLEDQIEIDRELMELQFVEANEIFEKLRDRLYSIEIVEEDLEEEIIVDVEDDFNEDDMLGNDDEDEEMSELGKLIKSWKDQNLIDRNFLNSNFNKSTAKKNGRFGDYSLVDIGKELGLDLVKDGLLKREMIDKILENI